MWEWLLFQTLRKRFWRSDSFWVSSFLYRDPIRRIPLLIDTALLLRSQFWPRERIDRLVELRLRDIVGRTRNIPLLARRYAEARVDPRTMTKADFSKLPILTKNDFYENEGGYTNKRLIAKSHSDTTSGSTGKPFKFHLDWRAELRYFAIRERMFRSDGKKFPVIYLRGRVNPGFFFGRHVLFFLRGYNTIKNRLPELLKLAKKYAEGFILYGYSSSMVELARRVADSKESFPVQAIFSTGEGLRESDRKFIEDSLHTKVFLTYATWEVKWVAHECEHRRYHVNEEYVYVEIVDDAGRPLPVDAEGNIIVTSFESEAMPFIRYTSGDRGALHEESCPCGRTLRTLTFSGRVSDTIDLPDGRSVPLFDLAVTFDYFADAVRQYRIVQKSRGSFTFLIVPGVEFEKKKEVMDQTFKRMMHPSIEIEWTTVDEIPQAQSGKAAYFVRQ